MKIDIVKHCGVALLLYCLCGSIVAGSNNIKIFQNVDGLVTEAPSEVQVPNGANLTLICQMENIKIKGIINDYVTWLIPPRVRSELKLRALKNSSNLMLSNVNTNEEGLYICASLKFKIFKTLTLLVKQSKPAELNYLNFSRLTKREVVPGYGLDEYTDVTDHYSNHRYLLEQINNNKAMHEDILKDIQNINKYEHNQLNNNFNFEDFFNNNDFNNHNTYSNPNWILYIIIAILTFGIPFAAFIIIFIVTRICKYRCQNVSTNRNSRQQNIHYPGITVPRSNRCGHASCSSSTCRLHDNSLSTISVINNGMDIQGPALIHNPVIIYPTTQLELPPTYYSSSTHNSTQNLINSDAANINKFNLPPSYDEAIGHRDNNHNATVGHNHGYRSSGHDHGVDNSHVNHSTQDAISGNDDSGGGGGDSGGGGGGGD